MWRQSPIDVLIQSAIIKITTVSCITTVSVDRGKVKRRSMGFALNKVEADNIMHWIRYGRDWKDIITNGRMPQLSSS